MSYQGSLAFCPAGIDACAFWRMFMPHLNVPNSRFLFTEGVPLLNEMAECDTIVVQRLMMEGNIKFLEQARAHGLKIIYDLDDNVWSMPDSNPAKHTFDTESTRLGLYACAEWADRVTVSTKELQSVVRKVWKGMRNVQTKKPLEVVHIDNCVDLRLFRLPIHQKNEDKIVIGWGGSNTHQGDVAKVWAILPNILARYSNVYLEFVGQEPPAEIRHHSRVRVLPWCHISEYPGRFATWNWDIVLAPLEEHRFNHSKSSIKMIEAGCIKAVCLAQGIAPYEYFTSFNKDLSWCLCYFTSDWEKKLDKLIVDKAFRRDLAELTYQNVVTNFSMERTKVQWSQLANDILL